MPPPMLVNNPAKASGGQQQTTAGFSRKVLPAPGPVLVDATIQKTTAASRFSAASSSSKENVTATFTTTKATVASASAPTRNTTTTTNALRGGMGKSMHFSKTISRYMGASSAKPKPVEKPVVPAATAAPVARMRAPPKSGPTTFPRAAPVAKHQARTNASAPASVPLAQPLKPATTQPRQPLKSFPQPPPPPLGQQKKKTNIEVNAKKPQQDSYPAIVSAKEKKSRATKINHEINHASVATATSENTPKDAVEALNNAAMAVESLSNPTSAVESGNNPAKAVEPSATTKAPAATTTTTPLVEAPSTPQLHSRHKKQPRFPAAARKVAAVSLAPPVELSAKNSLELAASTADAKHSLFDDDSYNEHNTGIALEVRQEPEITAKPNVPNLLDGMKKKVIPKTNQATQQVKLPPPDKPSAAHKPKDSHANYSSEAKSISLAKPRMNKFQVATNYVAKECAMREHFGEIAFCKYPAENTDVSETLCVPVLIVNPYHSATIAQGPEIIKRYFHDSTSTDENGNGDKQMVLIYRYGSDKGQGLEYVSYDRLVFLPCQRGKMTVDCVKQPIPAWLQATFNKHRAICLCDTKNVLRHVAAFDEMLSDFAKPWKERGHAVKTELPRSAKRDMDNPNKEEPFVAETSGEGNPIWKKKSLEPSKNIHAPHACKSDSMDQRDSIKRDEGMARIQSDVTVSSSVSSPSPKKRKAIGSMELFLNSLAEIDVKRQKLDYKAKAVKRDAIMAGVGAIAQHKEVMGVLKRIKASMQHHVPKSDGADVKRAPDDVKEVRSNNMSVNHGLAAVVPPTLELKPISTFGMTEKERMKVLGRNAWAKNWIDENIHPTVKASFGEMGVAKMNGYYSAVQIVSPFCVPIEVATMWFKKWNRFQESLKLQKSADKLPPWEHLVYWYGSNTTKEKFSFIPENKVIPWMTGKEKIKEDRDSIVIEAAKIRSHKALFRHANLMTSCDDEWKSKEQRLEGVAQQSRCEWLVNGEDLDVFLANAENGAFDDDDDASDGYHSLCEQFEISAESDCEDADSVWKE